MSNESKSDEIRLDLTSAQREPVKAVLDKDVESIDLDAQALEQRITPRLLMQ